jgi:creatinine amidohydrolase
LYLICDTENAEGNGAMSKELHRYADYTWKELDAVIGKNPIVLLPVGATEQHGPHLPLDVDVFLAEQACLESAKRRSDKTLVLPPVPYGLNLHHIDFPGTIHIKPEVFIEFCVNITKSLAFHGFKHIVIVNGHGSNTSLADIAARRTVLETKSLCASCNYFHFGSEAFKKIQTSNVMAHADEFETSLYLYLATEKVRMEEAVSGNDIEGQYLSSDSTKLVRFYDYWSRWTGDGVHGDPMDASPEKGKIIWEACISGMIEFLDEFADWKIEERRHMHSRVPDSDIRW